MQILNGEKKFGEMLATVLEALAQGKQLAVATVVAGTHPGYRCIMADGLLLYESSPAAGEKYKAVKEELSCVKAAGCRELDGERVFYEVLSQRPRLVVCGGGHVALAVVRLARLLHFPVTLLEDRPLFAEQARRAQADEVLCDSFEAALRKIGGGPDTYFVIVTRGHRYDKLCLEAILNKEAAYVGMMGSRSRVQLLKQALEAEGFSQEQLSMLHAPIGLEIQSETPEEIAVSIFAEIIAVKNGRRRSEGFTDEIIGALQLPGPKILATIVMRRGSAPRQPGTKMVILSDGTVRGTIGGGYAEAELVRTARLLLQSSTTEPELVQINMTNQEAAMEGMVCGGIQEVFLERIEDTSG